MASICFAFRPLNDLAGIALILFGLTPNRAWGWSAAMWLGSRDRNAWGCILLMVLRPSSLICVVVSVLNAVGTPGATATATTGVGLGEGEGAGAGLGLELVRGWGWSGCGSWGWSGSGCGSWGWSGWVLVTERGSDCRRRQCQRSVSSSKSSASMPQQNRSHGRDADLEITADLGEGVGPTECRRYRLMERRSR